MTDNTVSGSRARCFGLATDHFASRANKQSNQKTAPTKPAKSAGVASAAATPSWGPPAFAAGLALAPVGQTPVAEPAQQRFAKPTKPAARVQQMSAISAGAVERAPRRAWGATLNGWTEQAKPGATAIWDAMAAGAQGVAKVSRSVAGGARVAASGAASGAKAAAAKAAPHIRAGAKAVGEQAAVVRQKVAKVQAAQRKDKARRDALKALPPHVGGPLKTSPDAKPINELIKPLRTRKLEMARKEGLKTSKTAVAAAAIMTDTMRLEGARMSKASGQPMAPKGAKPSSRAAQVVTETDYDLIVAQRLARAGVLAPEEMAAAEVTGRSARRTHQSGTEIILEGQRVSQPMIVVSGWAYLTRVLPSGRRQVVGFLLPGDGVGLGHNVGARSATTVMALTTLQTVDATPLHVLACEPGREGLANALCGLVLQQEEFGLNQMTRIGMRSRAARLASLVLELRWRLCAAGLATPHDMPLPLTFETLADALGSTPEQAKSAMSALEWGGLVKFAWRRMAIKRPKKLQKLGEFRAPSVYEARRVQVEPDVMQTAAGGPVVQAPVLRRA